MTPFHEYNYPTKQLRLICMDGFTKPYFLGMLRLSEQLTSKQVVSHSSNYLEAQVAHLFLKCFGEGAIAAEVLV